MKKVYTPSDVKWGVKNIEKSKHINVKKKYETADGKWTVENLDIVLFNSIGKEVTYPVKATLRSKAFPKRTKYNIWSIDGKKDIVFGLKSELDLVEI